MQKFPSASPGHLTHRITFSGAGSSEVPSGGSQAQAPPPPPTPAFWARGPLIKLKSSPSCILERREDFPSPTLLSQSRCYRRVTLSLLPPSHCTASWRGREYVFNLRLPESDHKCKKTAPSPLPLSDLFA